MSLKVLDLFSGIGGFSLGLEKVGFETVAFVENDEACQEVLTRHWSETPIVGDIKKFDKVVLDKLQFEAERCARSSHEMSSPPMFKKIDLICGGFPCQDASTANTKGKGIDGKRTGLWTEFKRIIDDVRPKYVIAENVPNLRNRGLGRVIKDLAEIGYVGRADIIPARAFGAVHQRERLFILATHAHNHGFIRETYALSTQNSKRCWESNRRAKRPFMQDFEWPLEPSMVRVVHGISGWPHEARKRRAIRIKQLGNAVVPMIATWIGQQIYDYEEGLK
jgi:DNA (cytosine-5)-methyltransferase 1